MKSKRRIAIHLTDLDPSHGGMERVSYILSKELCRRGYELYAIHTNNKPIDKSCYSHYSATYQGDSSRLADIEGIINFVKNNQIEIFLNQIFTCYSSLELQKSLKLNTSVILINAFHTTPSLLDSLKTFSRYLPVPLFINQVLFNFHKIISLKPKYRKGNILSYKLCDAFVMLSEHYYPFFVEDNKIKDFSKLYAIPNPYEFKLNKNNQKEKIFLVVARLNNQQKRIDRVLKFWKEYHNEKDGWKLFIVGDGPDKNMLIKMSKSLNLRDCFFEGYSATPEKYYERAMIFLMTSDIEGFSMTLLEAVSHGCVPLAMDTFSALPDIITDKQNGMIVKKNDILGMINATNYILIPSE